MQPQTKIYHFSIRGSVEREFYIKILGEGSDMVMPCDYQGIERGFQLPWMTKEKLAEFLREAADLIEKTELE